MTFNSVFIVLELSTVFDHEIVIYKAFSQFSGLQLLVMYVGAGESRRTVGQICQKCKETSSHILYNSKAQNQIHTVKLRAVDRYTIQF